MLFAIQIGYASTTETSTSGKENPVVEEKQQQQTAKQTEIPEKLEEEPTVDAEVEINQDSLKDGSVSKYNFIFYFLYKFKYDEHEEVTP